MKSYEELLAERDALATQVVAMRISIISNCYDDPSTSGQRLMDLANRTPQQCLAEIKAEAVKAFADEIGVFSREYDDQGYVEVAKWKVQEHIAKVCQGEQSGTWLKDSNVNGGKRQCGEK